MKTEPEVSIGHQQAAFREAFAQAVFEMTQVFVRNGMHTDLVADVLLSGGAELLRTAHGAKAAAADLRGIADVMTRQNPVGPLH